MNKITVTNKYFGKILGIIAATSVFSVGSYFGISTLVMSSVQNTSEKFVLSTNQFTEDLYTGISYGIEENISNFEIGRELALALGHGGANQLATISFSNLIDNLQRLKSEIRISKP